jgi:NAD(P)-dependent dehydrogenase (short-subunit alcohol dehydrogenase family)
MQLRGRKALVTGGSRGIAAVARRLAESGAEVLVAATRLERVAEVAEGLIREGHRAFAAACDVTRPESIAALVDEAQKTLGRVDVLVNNAGVAGSAPIKSLSLEDWNRIMTVNATGTFLCTQAFVSEMAARGWGRIINVASITSRMGAPYIAAYTASKHAVLGFTRVAAAEYAGRGVTVNAVCPGYVDTDMTTDSVTRVAERTGLDHAAALAAILRTANQNRLITPNEVAFVVDMLASEEAAGVNGQAIVVDGGGLLA